MSLVDEFADFIGGVGTRTVELPFGRCAVWEVGTGAPLVLLHGIAGGRRLFFRVVPELAKRYRVIVPHLRGEERPDGAAHIDNYLDDIRVLLDRFDGGLSGVTMFGASFGGYLALAYAGRNDARVVRVAVQGAFLNYRLTALDRILMAASHLLPAAWGSSYYAWRVLRGRENEILGKHTPALVPLNAAWQRATPFASLRRRAMLISQVDATNAVRRMDADLVVAHGRNDPVVPYGLASRIVALRPDAQMTTWDDGGHMQMLTHPERFASLVSSLD